MATENDLGREAMELEAARLMLVDLAKRLDQLGQGVAAANIMTGLLHLGNAQLALAEHKRHGPITFRRN